MKQKDSDTSASGKSGSRTSAVSGSLGRLAINTEGFVFDPSTGESFTLNETGIVALRGLEAGKSVETIAAQLAKEFEVSSEKAERDVVDFMNHLRTLRILENE